MKKALVTLLLVATIAAGSVNCRLGFAAARLGIHVAASALVTAIHVAAWYSVANAMVVYPNYYDQGRSYQLQPGTQVYIIQRTADGRWCQIRTPNGQVGWVRYDALSGHVRSR